AHDELNGYIPKGFFGSNLAECDEFRASNPEEYIAQSMKSMEEHCRAMVGFQEKGAVVFDYGNNLRGQAQKSGFEKAFAYPGFVLAYVRPLFCQGRGPFRWIAQSGNPDDILATDKAIIEMFPDNKLLMNWIELAEKHLPWEGLPARVCWLGYGERHKFALRMNEMVRNGEIGPIAITRDHLDSGSVASPYRETEGMQDGTDAVADWPLLNALLNCASGADMVALHNGGGVGIGLSQHSGMMVVLDGSELTDERIERVFKSDPGMGVIRHADAGYDLAIKTAKEKGVKLPMMQ
ncbi:MAG: urocanate hydratase, partial [Thermoplasmata archaeon]|nr:urocanate hydratase [Thermoplasmata archaeon]